MPLVYANLSYNSADLSDGFYCSRYAVRDPVCSQHGIDEHSNLRLVPHFYLIILTKGLKGRHCFVPVVVFIDAARSSLALAL